MSIRWGVAGTGKMAEVFLTDLALVKDAEAAWVGSRTAERAAEFARLHGVASSGTYRDLVGADLDVLYIATPHPQHHALALAAIDAGIPVLVEKAFTATVAGAREVVSAARARGVFCMEAMWTRFQPAVVRAREIVAEGGIGELRIVQADLGAYRAFDPSDRLFDPALGGGSVLDLGVYVVSLAQHFLGTPDRVSAAGTTFPNGADAGAAIQLAYADGRAASLVCSLTGESPGRAFVLGTEGSIELGPRFHHPTEMVLRRNGEHVERMELPSAGRGYVHEVEEVHRCLAAGLTESAVMPLADTLVVQEVLEETLTQLGVSAAEAPVSW